VEFFFCCRDRPLHITILTLASSHVYTHRQHNALLPLVSVQVLLQFIRLGWYAMMIERLGSLVRIIGQIFKVNRAFLSIVMSNFDDD